jgi:hypothetical protein
MRLAILKVILWPKDTSHVPRIIPFEPGRINIISGENGSGKSTITWIIDYCLGSEKCSIPVGLIRDVTGWFGLHLGLANTEMIVARRNPGDQQATTDVYWTEGLELSVPPIIVAKNARVEGSERARSNGSEHKRENDLQFCRRFGANSERIAPPLSTATMRFPVFSLRAGHAALSANRARPLKTASIREKFASWSRLKPQGKGLIFRIGARA